MHDALGGHVKGGSSSLGRIDPVDDLLPVPVLWNTWMLLRHVIGFWLLLDVVAHVGPQEQCLLASIWYLVMLRDATIVGEGVLQQHISPFQGVHMLQSRPTLSVLPSIYQQPEQLVLGTHPEFANDKRG